MAVTKVTDGTPTQLQIVGHVPKNIFQSIFSIFIIHMRLYCRCVKIWMVKIWQIFGWSSILPSFRGAKVSLYTVASLATPSLLW